MKKINIYKNGKYIFSTTRFKTCKEAIAYCKSKKLINVASIPNYTIMICNDDKITARFEK